MAQHKRHHFVPQFYLRNFAGDPKKGSVRLFNLATAGVVPRAGIKGQCHHDHYYGTDDTLEKAIGQLEGKAATVIANALKGLPLRQFSRDHRVIVDFTASLLGRTEAAEVQLNEMVDGFAKHLLKRARPDLADLDGYKIGWNNAVVVALGNALTMSPTMWDLHIRILAARNAVEFIVSDNPVVLFNQMFDPVASLATRGLANAGLQVYLPLSSSRALLFYDPNMYRPIKSKNGVVPVFPIDTRQLNALQYLNARKNIYWSSETMDAEVLRLHEEFRGRRVDKVHSIRSAIVEETGDRVRELVSLERARATFIPEFRFLAKQKHYGVVPSVRAPEWTEIVREFVREVENGQCSLADFLTFAESHPMGLRALDAFARDDGR